jgi:hypothetical protein
MNYCCPVEEVFPLPWGNIPIIKRLPFERVHKKGDTIFIDNRKLQMPRLHEKTRSKNCTFQPVIIDPANLHTPCVDKYLKSATRISHQVQTGRPSGRDPETPGAPDPEINYCPAVRTSRTNLLNYIASRKIGE